MKKLRQFSPLHKSASIVRRRISHFLLGLLTLFLITAVLPVAAQHSPIASIEQHTTHASTQLAQGITLYEAGQISDAAAVWQQAAQDYEAKGDRLNQALSLNYLSLAYQDLGQWQNAQKAISQSLELIPPNNPFILAQVLNTQGSLQLALGKAEAALDTWKQAEHAYQSAGDEVGVIGTQINQAQALQTLGLYRRAKTNLEQVNQKLQTQPDSLLKAAGLRSLGVALQVVGDLQKSQEVLEQSLAIQERLHSAGDTSATLFSLGNTHRALQDYPKAKKLYQKAAKKATNPLSQLEAQLNQLSLLVQTEQWQAAQALLPTIQRNLTQLPPSRSAVYAQVNLAESLMKLSALTGKVERSPNPQLSSTALTDMAQLLAKAVQQARMLKDSRAESYALGELAHLYEYTQNFPEAQKLTQDALNLAQAINASDITYRWQWQLGRIHKHQGELKGGLTQPHTVQALAAYTEAVKALQSLRSDLVAINPDVQFSFRESVEPIYRELVELLLQSLPEQDQVSRQENLKQARQVIESLQLAELDNFFREACLDSKPEQIDRVDPTAAVIYPIILSNHFAVILSRPGQPLSYYQTQLRQSEVEGILEQFLQSLNRSFSNKQRLRFAQQVYDWLIRPAEAQLAESGVKTLVFVLDGSLRNLPMAALHDGKQYLVENYSIALSQGLQLLEPRSLARNRLTALTGGLTEARQGFAALPGVKSELQQISSEVRSEVLLNQDFTQKRLEKKMSALSFPVIHLATHAQFSSKAEDTFLLTWDGRIKVKDFDELLQSRERQNQNPIELLVLSACQTAAGDKRATLGLAGLAVRSGARSTLATLWSVSDESTAEFMAEFYRELFQTQVSKAEAVRQSQLILLKKSKYEHPYYWAPFVLVGNWL
ncbi:CHAT domain-containing protein [Microcoleus sp. ZQ-A2]|nr:CHAT domain-containing protein [Microcoleus sp. FACHB-1]